MTVPVWTSEPVVLVSTPSDVSIQVIGSCLATVCDFYAVVINIDTPTPNAAEVIAGTGGSGWPAVLTANVLGVHSFDAVLVGLLGGYRYKVCFVARDTANPGDVTAVYTVYINQLADNPFSLTYGTLKLRIQQYLETYESSFVDCLDTFINTAEVYIYNLVNIPANRVVVSGTVDTNTIDITNLRNWLYPDSLSLVVSGKTEFLLQKELNYLQAMYPETAYEAVPKIYAIADSSSIKVAPVPDTAYNYTLSYYANYTSIVDVANDDNTSWLSERFPNVLLFGALVQAAIFNKTDITVYEAQFDRFLGMLTDTVDRKNQQDQYRQGVSSR